VQFQYEITLPEFLEMAWLRHRSSIRWIIGISLGALILSLGVVFYIYVNHWFGLYLISLSALLLLMLMVIPSLTFRRFYHRNRRMFAERKVTITETGIVSDTQLGHAETTWDNYEQVCETRNLFLLYQTTDVIGILPKRVFAGQQELEQIKSLLSAKVRPRKNASMSAAGPGAS